MFVAIPPRHKRHPRWVTPLLVVALCAAFVWTQSMSPLARQSLLQGWGMLGALGMDGPDATNASRWIRLLSALFLHGDWSHLLGNLVFLMIFGLMGIKLFAKFVEMPKAVLIPLILVLCVVGTYSINSSMTEVYWMLGFGILGYLLKIFGFQMGPIILGAILGPLMDTSYRQAMSSAGDNPASVRRSTTSSWVKRRPRPACVPVPVPSSSSRAAWK